MSLFVISFMPFAERNMPVTFLVVAHSIESRIWGMPSLATGVAGVSGSKMLEAKPAIQLIIF